MSIFGREKVVVYIDGSNTYNKLKKLGLPEEDKRFDFSAFVSHIVGERQLVSKRYYVGMVRNHDNSEKSEKLVRKQQQFLETLRAADFEIKRGKIMYDGGRIREKGVDVKLAIDLVIGAADNLYDTAVVVTSDTDIIPAMKYARYKKKKIEYVGFAGAPSFGMIKESGTQRLFAKEDLLLFQYHKVEVHKQVQHYCFFSFSKLTKKSLKHIIGDPYPAPATSRRSRGFVSSRGKSPMIYFI